MNIVILGGSFDPPHLGHILIARQIKEMLPVDQVWLMPAYHHTFNKNLSPAAHRLAMTKFLTGKNIVVSDFEIANKSSGVTIDTLRALAKKYPQHTFSWIIGSDQLKDFHRWGKNWRAIFGEFHLIIFPREVALNNLTALVKKHLRLTSIPDTTTLMQSKDLVLTNISSSLVRKRVQKDLPIDLLVPDKVQGYIKRERLYR